MDVTTTAVQPVTFSGLDIQSGAGPACDTWNMSFVSNSSGRTGADFTIIGANTPEGSTAITPVPSSTGQGNLAGDYVWDVQCSKDGNASNIVQLTYHTIANAVNVGSADRTDFGVYPSGFGNTPGAKILFSTGFDKSKSRFDFRPGALGSNEVMLQDADTNKHANLTNLAFAGLSNLHVYNLRFSGSQHEAAAAGATCTICLGSTNSGTSNVIFDNVYGYFSESLMPFEAASWLAFGMNGCISGCEIRDSGIDYALSGLALQNNSVATFRNSWLRHVFSDCTFNQNSGNSSGEGWLIVDSMCIAPMTRSAVHPDNGQVADDASPYNTTILRFMQPQADGDDNTQGMPFTGGAVGAVSDGFGYVDDGTAGHGPGKVLTLTGDAFGFAGNGSVIYSDYGSPIGLNDNVRINTGGSSTHGTLDIPTDVNIGSPGSPVQIWTKGPENFNIHGIIYASGQFRGASWTRNSGSSSFTNFAIINQPANPFYTTSFTGQIGASGVLTITGPITNNIPTSPPPYWLAGPWAGSGGRISYSGCDYCGPGISYQLTGNRGNFTANQSGTTLHVTAVDPGMVLKVGDIVSGAGIPAPTGLSGSWTIINSQSSGTPGGVGDYIVSKNNGTVSSGTMTAGEQGGPGTYQLSSSPSTTSAIPMSISLSYPVDGGGGMYFNNCASAGVHTGTLTIDSGYAAFFSEMAGCPSVVSSNTILNSTLVAADYASGMLPADYLAQWSQIQWLDMQPSEIKTKYCLAFKPAIGGHLDMGGGKWYGPITGETNVDGTGGGDWITDNTYESDGTHIPDCEVAP